MRTRFELVNYKTVLASLSLLGLVSCHSGGKVSKSASEHTSVAPTVRIPTIASPSASPFYSRDNAITVTGMCMDGYKVSMSGAFNDFQTCVDASFSFTIQKSEDGIYTFLITQKDLSGIVSAPASIVWIRKTSIAQPLVTSPSGSPYLSAQSSLPIVGSCENGATVTLSIDGVGSTTCVNSQFSMSLPKAVDGDYNIQVTQTDSAGNTASSIFIWQKHALTVSPSSPFLQVTTSQVFSVSGGSGIYTTSLLTNHSGALYDSSTKNYTAGSLANVSDTIRVTDSLGVVYDVNITTVAGLPDHLTYGAIDGNNQSANVGSALSLPLTAKVVDQFENGIPYYPLFAHLLEGDSLFTSPVLQLSDLNGELHLNMRMGFTANVNVVEVTPFSATLPDRAATGNRNLLFYEHATSNGRGALGSYFSVGQNPNNIATDDIDGDGNNDSIVLNSGEPSIGILRGLGNGLFMAMTKIRSICAQPNGMALGDLNHDGKKDIVISCGSSILAAAQVLLSNGDGTFQNPTNVAIADGESIPSAVILKDINGDTFLDLIISMAGSAEVAVRLGNNNGSFQPAVEYSVGGGPSALAVGDFNKDGKLDLAVVNSSDNTFSILLNQGGGGFGTQNIYDTGNSPIAIAVDDFNGDSYADVAIVNNSESTVGIYTNNHMSGFDPGAVVPVGGGPNSLVVRDFDGDGKVDIAVSNGDESTITFAFGIGNGLFEGIYSLPVTLNPTYIYASDVNKDNQSDILVVGNGDRQLQVLPGQAQRFFGFATAVDNNPNTGAVGDFDRDGKLDAAVVAQGSKNINILKGQANGLFVLSASLFTDDNTDALAVVDLRGNGKKDIVAVNPNKSSIRVFLGNGDGSFSAPIDYLVGNTPASVAVQDFNRDGKADLAVVNSGNNTVTILMGVGDGTFLTGVNYQTGGTPAGLIAADMNRDYIIDLVITNKTSGTVSVLVGNDDGTFQNHIDYTIGGGPSAIVVGDFNNDANFDIAVTNVIDGTVAVSLGNGDGTLRSPLSYSAGLNPLGLLLGDFNGDGKADLALANGVNGVFTVLWGSSNGQFNTSTSFVTNGNTNGLVSGDFNADGALDLMVFDGSSNKAQMWLGH